MTTARTNVPSLARAASVAALVSALVAGCGSVNTTYTRDRPADTAVDARTRVNDLLQQIFLSAKEVRMFRNSRGVMEVQVDVENNGFKYRSFSYLFDWVDARGNVIPSQLSVWKTTNVPDGGATVIRAIAPNEEAADFRLQIRRSD